MIKTADKKFSVVNVVKNFLGKSKKKDMTVRELITGTYDTLADRNAHTEIVLPEGCFAEIANDSDDHRLRAGYMEYKNANMFLFGGINWVVSRGERCGDYPARPYDSDIIALGFEKSDTEDQILKKIRDEIAVSFYFSNSLIYGKSDGTLVVSEKSRFRMAMGREIEKSDLSGFVAQKPEYNEGCILASTLEHPATRYALYKPEFALFLAGKIEKVLGESKIYENQ